MSSTSAEIRLIDNGNRSLPIANSALSAAAKRNRPSDAFHLDSVCLLLFAGLSCLPTGRFHGDGSISYPTSPALTPLRRASC